MKKDEKNEKTVNQNVIFIIEYNILCYIMKDCNLECNLEKYNRIMKCVFGFFFWDNFA